MSYQAIKYNDPFDLKCHKRQLVVSFSSLHTSTSGVLRVDHSVKCMNPTATSFKYIEHMRSRGWTVVVHGIRLDESTKGMTIILRMYK